MDRYLQKSGNIACPGGCYLSGSNIRVKMSLVLKDNGVGYDHHSIRYCSFQPLLQQAVHKPSGPMAGLVRGFSSIANPSAFLLRQSPEMNR
jgi:hypothetical protein